jgi:hypothetical protein
LCPACRGRSGWAGEIASGYAFAGIGAVVAMRVEDNYPNGKRWWVRLHESPRVAGHSARRRDERMSSSSMAEIYNYL